MTDLANLPSSTRPGAPNGHGPAGGRTVERRRGLPGGRAVVGGFLVAVAAVGIFAAYTSATAPPTVAYAVAARDVALGETLTRADIDLVAFDLPSAQRARAYTDPSVLVGATVLGAVQQGELIQQSDVVRPDGAGELAQISFPVEGSHALNGRLQSGELVDVIVTYGSGAEAVVRTLATGVRVVRMDVGGDAIGSTGGVTVTLAVAPERLEALAKGAVAGKLTVVRTTGLVRGGAEEPSTPPTTASPPPVAPEPEPPAAEPEPEAEADPGPPPAES